MTAQQENAPNHPEAERYYSEYIHLRVDKDSADVILRVVFNERARRGWKLISAIKEPSGDVLRLEWDAWGSFFK